MEEQLVREYLGKNYDNIKNDKFNYQNFVLPFIYMFYKGMILYTFMWITITLLIFEHFYERPDLFIIIFMLLHIFVSFNFNSLYLDFVTSKVKKIMKKHHSYESASTFTKDIASPKTAIIRVILIIAIIAGCYCIAALIGVALALLFGIGFMLLPMVLAILIIIFLINLLTR